MTSSMNPSTNIEKETGYRSLLMHGMAESMDRLFPLFDAVFQKTKLSRLIYYPILIYYFVGAVLVSLWPNNRFWDEENTPESMLGFLNNIKYIFWISPTPLNEENIVRVAISLLAVCLLSFLLLATQMIYFSIYRRFIEILNYPIRFFGDIAMYAISLPTMVAVGNGFILLVRGEASTIMWLYIGIGIIAVIYECTYYYMIQSMASKSVCIIDSPFLNFDSFVVNSFVISTILVLAVTYILLYFEEWAILIGIAVHLIIYSYMLFRIMFMPFVTIAANCIVAGVISSCLLNDLLMFVAYFFPKMDHRIPIIFSGIGLIICILIFYFIFSNRVKRIVFDLGDTEEKLSEEERFMYYNSLGLDKNEKFALMYLYTGFENMCSLFLDWSLLKFILQSYSSESAVCGCLQILNFFPGESRLLNRLTVTVTSRRNLDFVQRFLIYQVYKIKTLRQFSASSESNAKLSELKTMSRQCENVIRSALEMQSIDASFYENLSSICSHANAIWKESLSNYPNNQKLCEEFCRYLIECECSFPEALKIRRRGELIEIGKNYSIDYSFRSMVRVFPQYLKKNVLDLKGNMKINVPSRRGSSNSSTGQTHTQQSFSTTSDSQLDDEVEETIGRQTLNQSKTRLALHRALEHKLPNSIKLIIPMTAFVLFIVICLFLFTIFFSVLSLSNQTDSMARLDYLSKTRFYISMGNLQILFQYTMEKGILNRYIPSLIPLSAYGCDSLISLTSDFLTPIIKWASESNSNYQNLINNLASFANEGSDVYDLASSLLYPIQTFTYCSPSGIPASQSNISISSHIALMLMHQRVFSGVQSTLTMMQDSKYCEIVSNLNSFYSETNDLFSNFCNFQIEVGDDLKWQFNLLMYIMPVVLFIVVFIPFINIHFATKSAINQVTEVILSFEPKIRSDAKNLLSLNADNDETKMVETPKTRSKSIIFIVLIVAVTLGLLALAIVMSYDAVLANQNIINLNTWDQYASLRLSLSSEIMNTALFGAAIADYPNLTILTNAPTVAYLTQSMMNSLVNANQDLLQGTNISEPCIGYDDVLDSLNVLDKEINSSNLDMHELYAYSSINQQISMLSDLIASVIDSLKVKNQVDVDVIAHGIHICNSHLWNNLFGVTARLNELATIEYSNLTSKLINLSIGVIVLILLFILIVFIYQRNRVNSYKASLFILKRIPPVNLVNNKLFMHEFLNNREELREEKLTVAGNIIHNATDAIFCTSIHGVVEIVNSSVTTLLGYTPEQLLGQPVPAFFIPDDEVKINQQLELIRNGHSSSFYEDTFTCVTDASQLVPCLVTILGMKSNNGDEVKSFVVILRDQTNLMAQQKQAEEAKTQSEKLLFQILPRDIVIRLNRGEKDISFSVPSVSIIFIDIVRFSEYSLTLSPNEIMGNLSQYFSVLDHNILKYPLLTKIKLIGDIYMAAAGLFNLESPAEAHAEQTVRYGLDIIGNLDDINLKLNANLSIRIGINSGGPVIAGVLGKDKPVFDIIGDPINVAARLQTTDEPNHIQIPQSTYEYIKGMSFNVEQRGEVFLKGKGQTMTYFVTPSSSLLAQISSNDFSSDRI